MTKSLACAVFALVFSLYMLTYSRAMDLRADEGAMFLVTESLVKFQRASIDQGNHLQYLHWATIGPDGSHYAKYGVAQSLAAAPLYALGLAVPALGLIDVTLLLNPLVGALSAVVVMLTALELGAPRGRAVGVSLMVAFCTSAWVYAKNFSSEPLSALGLALASWGTVIMLARGRAAGAILAGAGVGLAILVRSSAAITAPVLWLVAWRYGGVRRWRCLAASFLPVVIAVCMTGLYNGVRFGNILQSGYGEEGFAVYPWVGVLGMLFAPGRSLFIYVPLMLAAVPGLWAFKRPAGLRVWLVGAAIAMLLVHGAWWSWWGAWTWGPRFLVPVLPLLTLGMLGVLDVCSRASRLRRPLRILTGVLIVSSLLMQLPGVLVHRAYFFWRVMQVFPDAKPDEAALYTFRVSMPLFNLGEVLRGNLDLAWKPGLNAPLDRPGLTLILLGVCVGVVGLGGAWRNSRASGVAAGLSLSLVLAIAAVTLVYFQTKAENPFRALWGLVEERVPPDAVLLMGDATPQTNWNLVNVNRSRRHIVGAPLSDAGQIQLHTLPLVRRAMSTGRPVWYLQTENEPPQAFWAELEAMGLCAAAWPVEAGARLVEWKVCSP